MKIRRLFFILLLSGLVLPAVAGPNEEVAAATNAWVEAFASHDAGRITALYAPDAVFWGTTSPVIRDTPELIQTYFENLKSRPTLLIELGEQHIRVYGDIAINSGYYIVHEIKEDQPVTTPLRFSFVYRRNQDRWLIIDHHSSALPLPR